MTLFYIPYVKRSAMLGEVRARPIRASENGGRGLCSHMYSQLCMVTHEMVSWMEFLARKIVDSMWKLNVDSWFD